MPRALVEARAGRRADVHASLAELAASARLAVRVHRLALGVRVAPTQPERDVGLFGVGGPCLQIKTITYLVVFA